MVDSFSPGGTVMQESFTDSFTSSGRDMYVRFVTDAGNAGLMGTTQDPGFYAEWSMIRLGDACPTFTSQPNTALVGHNNEDLADVSLEDCESACCARPWCKSFDFASGKQGPAAKGGRCELADMDASDEHGRTSPSTVWTMYERNGLPPPSATLGSAGCATQLASVSDVVNANCCPAGGCDPAAPPLLCSVECSTVWLPFSRICSEYLVQTGGAAAAIGSVT